MLRLSHIADTPTQFPSGCILPAPAGLPAERGAPIQSWLYTSLIFASHRAPSGGCFTLWIFAPTDGKRNKPQFRRISCLYVLFDFWMLAITSASQSAVNRTVKHQMSTCSTLLHFSVSLQQLNLHDFAPPAPHLRRAQTKMGICPCRICRWSIGKCFCSSFHGRYIQPFLFLLHFNLSPRPLRVTVRLQPQRDVAEAIICYHASLCQAVQ